MLNVCSKVQEAKTFLENLWKISPQMRPKIALVLGSGLSNVAEKVKSQEHFSCEFRKIPHFGTSNVEGHKGEIILGKFGDQNILILSGRLHFYEGHSPQDVVFPIRVLAAFGVKTVILTNASGAIRDNFQPGEFMCINDHINLTGNNPLTGPNDSTLGPRFVDMSNPYDSTLMETALACAKKANINMHTGVYVGLSGPTYETPAEIRMLKILGGDAVGMSTVYETIAARHMDMKVLAFSCLTNKAAGLSQNKINHEEVMEINARASVKLASLLQDIVSSLP